MLTVYCLSGEMSSGGNVLHPTSGFNGQLGLIVHSGARLGKQAELQMTTTYQPLFTFRQPRAVSCTQATTALNVYAVI